jgi:galactokinase
VTENVRVRELAAILRDEGAVDRGELGRIFLAGHASLRDDYEVSTPELDWLVEAAYDGGAVAARMTGGGFGGSVLALVDVDAAEELGSRVRAGYAERFRREAAVRVCAAAAGARELS